MVPSQKKKSDYSILKDTDIYIRSCFCKWVKVEEGVGGINDAEK